MRVVFQIHQDALPAFGTIPEGLVHQNAKWQDHTSTMHLCKTSSEKVFEKSLELNRPRGRTSHSDTGCSRKWHIVHHAIVQGCRFKIIVCQPASGESRRLGFCNAASRATDFLGIFADGAGCEKRTRHRFRCYREVLLGRSRMWPGSSPLKACPSCSTRNTRTVPWRNLGSCACSCAFVQGEKSMRAEGRAK